MSVLDDDALTDLDQIEELKKSPYYEGDAAATLKRAEVKVRIRSALTKAANRRFRLLNFVLHYLDADLRAAAAVPPPPKREAFLKYFDQDSVASVEFVLELVVVQLVSSVEYFLFDAMRCVLLVYPESLSSTQVPLGDVISKGQQELIDNAIKRHLNDLSYKRPEEYVKEVSRMLRLSNIDTNIHWKKFFELKARRDLGAHNDWIVNELYLRKVDLELRPNIKLDERLRIDFEYFQASSDNCGHLESAIVKDLLTAWK
jgi:hypothetical protein